MAYGLLLYKEIETPQGTQRLEIYKDGYTGAAVEIDALRRDSITIGKDSSDIAQAITTSVLSFAVADTGVVDYLQFSTPSATLFKVVWLTDGAARWTGFITPDSYSENLAYRDTLTLTARDNLGRLNDYDFDLARGQMLSVEAIVTAAISKAGVAMPLAWATTKTATYPTATGIRAALVNTSLFAGKTWHEALTMLLEGCGLTLAWADGNAFRVQDITAAPAQTQPAFFVGKSGYRQITPAWKNVTVEQDYGLRDNFYEGQFTKQDTGGSGPSVPTFTPPAGGLWRVTGTMALLNPYNGAPSPLETIYPPIQAGDGIDNAMTYTFHVPSILRAIKLTLSCSNTAWRSNTLRNAIWGQKQLQTGMSAGRPVMHYYWLRYRFNVFFVSSSGQRYVLRESWEVYDPATIAEPYLYFVMPGSEGNLDADNDIELYIAELPGAGDIELTVYPVVAQIVEAGDPVDYATGRDYGRITDITFAVQEGIGARNKLVTINSEHNIQSGISVSLGQVPEGIGNSLAYLGGLFAPDADFTPLKAWTREDGGAEYDLLELVAREHITYNNAQYDTLSGTMMLPSAAIDFGKGIAFGGKIYRIVGASLAVISNTLSAQMLREEAPFATAEYTVEDVDVEGGGRGASSGGGIAQGAGGGDSRYFAPVNDEEGSLVGAKALYDLHIIQEAADEDLWTPEVTKDITEILRHLALQVINEGTEQEETILVTDLTLASSKNLIAGGIGGGSEPGAGGSLATLADVALGTLAAGDILRYNATTSHWENVQPSLALLTDVALGTPTDGQALIWDATLGRWRPGTVQGGGGIASVGLTMPTGFAVAGSPLMSDGTLQVSFAAGYALPTTADVTKGTTAYGWGNHASAGYLTTATADGRYGAGLNYASNRLHLVNKDGTSLSYLTAANLVTVLGNTAVNRATADANGNTIASQSWVTTRGYLTSVAFGDLTSHPTTLSGYGITDAKISGGTITLGGNTITPLASVAFGDLTSHPTTLSGYGITDAKISGGTITLGANTLTPLTDVSVVSGDNTIGTSLTIIGQVKGVNIRAKIAAYLLAADFTATNIVSTLGTTAVNRATADASGNTITSSYLRKDTDDTMSANLTIGQPNLSGSKTLTIYGRNNDTTPALTIYGVASATTRYTTKIYRDATALQVVSSLAVDGNITATGNLIAGSASDRRLKRNIETIGISEAAGILSALRPVRYQWNDKAGELGHLSGVSRGFLADEYNDIIPNATRKIWGEYDAIDYLQVLPYLVAGWQQQNLRIRTLEGEIAALREDNKLLRRAVL